MSNLENWRDNWNEYSTAKRYALLLKAHIHNLTFAYLDWDDVPRMVQTQLQNAAAKGKQG